MTFYIAASFLILSGVASLTYQVAWVRLLGLSMGSTSASISTVLAAFFIGMALGSFLAEKITRNRIDSFKPYIALELLIAISGLALLPLLLNLDQFMAWFPAAGTSLTLKFFVATILLSVPTICMGATFPVMASILVRHHQEVGLRISQLYALNTGGAVLGAALSGFVFIPAWGLDGAIYTAVLLNLSIVAAAFYFNRRVSLPPVVIHEVNSPAAPIDEVGTADRRRALAILFVTGFVAIATQVGWTKYLAIFTGTTIYGFAAILTVFLLGIACGSWAMRPFIERITKPGLWLVGGLILLGLSLLLTQAGLTLLPKVYTAVNHLKFDAWVVFAAKYWVVFVLIFIPTFLFGAIFPLNLKLYCGGIVGVRSRVGKAYAVNTLASIAGAILSGFWIIPTFGTSVLLTSMALITLASTLVFMPSLKLVSQRTALGTSLAFCAIAAWILPQVDYADLIVSVQYRYDADARKGEDPKIVFLKEGKAGVISMITYDEKIYKLQNNGLNESVLDPLNPDRALLSETLLGLLPYFLHDDPKTGFIVGFGGGVTARALTLTDLDSIRVVELEPAVIDAGRALYEDEIPALKDPRVRIDFNDARNTLLVEQTKYDIIAAQPSHPWLARASNVFTQEFWQIVDSRLNDNGIFSQWVNLFNMDASTLRSIYKGFYNVFPHGVSFVNLDTGDLLLIGGKTPITFDYEKLAKHIEDPRVHNVLSQYSIHTPNDLMWYVALTRDEALAAAVNDEPNTDTNILSEVRLSALVNQPTGEEDPYGFLQRAFTMDLAQFFGDNAHDRFYSLARYAIEWSNYYMLERAHARLKEYDENLARAIEYEALHRRYKYAAATELYEKHENWHPRVHMLQALALLELDQKDDALAAIERISDENERRSAYARVLYELHDWDALAKITPATKEESKWQLAARAHIDPRTIGDELEAMVDEDTDDVHLIRIMVQRYSAVDDIAQMEHWARHLVRVIDKESKRLSELARNAIKDEDLETAYLIVKHLESVNPDFDELASLRRRLAQKGVVSLAQVDKVAAIQR